MRTLPLAPLMHGACWWLACISLLLGHTVVLSEKRSLDAVHVWDLVEREKVNMLSFVGDAMAIPLLDALRAEPGRWKIDSLFGIGSGGAVFSDWVQDGFREIFPKVVVTNSFGSSETGAQGQDDGKNREEGGLGRIARGEHAQVITRDGRIIEPGSGEQGYLARSGHVPIGYYNAPEKSAEIFVEAGGRNWVLTGDRATVDADGGLVIFGRGVNCINSGGEKIFPEEVEIAIKQHPAVFDALVVATPRPAFQRKGHPPWCNCARTVPWTWRACSRNVASTSPATRSRGSCTWFRNSPAPRAASPTIQVPGSWHSPVRTSCPD